MTAFTPPPPHPGSTSPQATATMRANRSRDTGPEMAVRRAAHALGLRFFVDYRLPLEGVRRRCDLAFPRARVAVFVDRCYWHGCPDHCKLTSGNRGWWETKLRLNRQRDRDTDARLLDAGWTVVRVWEHECPETAALQIFAAVDAARRAT